MAFRRIFGLLTLMLSPLASMATTPEQCEIILATKQLKRGSLFSAIQVQDTQLGKKWSQLYPEAKAAFPGLKIKKPQDAHITQVYMGGDWKFDQLATFASEAIVKPADTITLNATVERLGRNQQVVVAELHGIPSIWAERVVAAKTKLAQAGLRKADSFDSNFRGHVTLAESKNFQPTPEDAQQLEAFQAWIEGRLSKEDLQVTLGPSTPIELMLAGSTRPKDGPEYLSVENFLKLYFSTP